MKRLYFILFFFPVLLYGQFYLDKGDWYFGRNRFPEAIKYYIKEAQNPDQAIKDEAIMRLVDSYMFSGKIKEANIWYKKIYYYNRKDPNVVLRYAMLQLADKKYNTAKSLFERYKKTIVNDSLNIGDQNIAFCDSVIKWEKYSIENADVRNLRQINSRARDFCTVKYKNSVAFCSSKYPGEKPKEEFYDLYKFSFDPFTLRNKSIALQSLQGLNSTGHEGPATFSSDGLKVWFTRPVKGTVINEKQINPLNLFFSEYKNGAWTEPTNKFGFDYNTDFYSSCHPALSTDGATMFFASNMPGGFGGMDIYFTTYQDSTGWSDAVNLGPEVNTYEDELFPTIGENGVLFFSSKGHPGLGEMDIFKCVYNKKTNAYTKVENMKKPINSSYDDFALLTMGSNDYGLFSSDRAKGKGEDDIYSFLLLQKQEFFIEKTAINIPDKIFYDGITYKYKIKGDKDSIKVPVVGDNYSLNFKDFVPIQFLANKDSLYYNQSELIVSRNETGDIFYASCYAKDKPILLHGLLADKTTSRVYKNHHVYVLDNELPLDTLITNDKGWFDFEIPAGKRLDFIAFDSLAEKDFFTRKYIQMIVKVQDYAGTPLPKSQVILLRKYNETGLLITDSLGKCSKIFREGLEMNLIISKEGFFNKDTVITIKGSDPQNIVINLRSKEKETIQGQIVFNDQPLENVEITVTKGNELIEKVKTDDKGKYELHLHKNEEYDVSISKKGFFNTDTVLVTNTKPSKDTANPIKTAVNIKVNEIKINKTVKLNHIYFEYNSFELTQKTKNNLEHLADFLRINSKLIVEVSSHTDNRGSEGFNLILSQKRADAVVNFLKYKNIEPERLVAIGYGETQPIIKSPVTEEEHSQNRRTEFKVLKSIDSTKTGDYFRVLAFHSKNQLASNVPLFTKYKNILIEKDKNDIYRYYVSPIRTYDETKGVVKELNSMGYRDTKIEAFDDGEPVPVEELIY